MSDGLDTSRVFTLTGFCFGLALDSCSSDFGARWLILRQFVLVISGTNVIAWSSELKL